jgi:hypothetical protein
MLTLLGSVLLSGTLLLGFAVASYAGSSSVVARQWGGQATSGGHERWSLPFACHLG